MDYAASAGECTVALARKNKTARALPTIHRRGFEIRRTDEPIGEITNPPRAFSEARRFVRLLLHEALSFSGGRLSESETNAAWRKLSWFAEKEYLVTNYINPTSFFDTGQAKNIFQLQKAKLRVNETFQVRKVLIWKDASERDSQVAREILQLQQDDSRARMDVREIVYDTISKRAGLMNDLQKELHGRIDFAVFDNLVVVIWNLND